MMILSLVGTLTTVVIMRRAHRSGLRSSCPLLTRVIPSKTYDPLRVSVHPISLEAASSPVPPPLMIWQGMPAW